MRCGLAPAAVFLTLHLPTGKVLFFCKKMSKTGKKGRFIDIDSVFVYCYKYRC